MHVHYLPTAVLLSIHLQAFAIFSRRATRSCLNLTAFQSSPVMDSFEESILLQNVVVARIILSAKRSTE